MANKEQLAILKQGVAAWNKWREENPDVEIDLRSAKLDWLDLSGANFQKANLCDASFLKSILIKTNFSDAKFDFTYLLHEEGDNLVKIKGVDFSYSILKYAVFDRSIFYDSKDESKIKLQDDYFEAADEEDRRTQSNLFEGAILDYISLKDSQINKKYTNLSFGNRILDDKDLIELLVLGSGRGRSFKGKDLRNTHLVNFDLRCVDLRETKLMQANLSGADITGAKFYDSERKNWIIDGIRCDYVYWDEDGKQRTPPDRDFRPGEFEELYSQQPTFKYVFVNDFSLLDALIMERVVQAVNERHKEFSLELVNFDKRGQPHATFTVCHLEHVEKAKQQIAAGYERNKIAPDQRDQLMAAVLGLIENQNELIDKIPSPPLPREMKMGDTYNIYGGQIGAIGQSASASGNIFQQITAELPRVHEEMRRSAASPEQKAAAEDVAKAAQAAQQQNEPAVRQHLKNAGKFALDCAQKIGAEALAEYLKKMTLGL